MRTTIYIGEWRVDQYPDESVDVVSSVLDITDITKNKGDYTKTFTVPASKRNGIVFKHWYDANIDNSFDARTKIDGRIELDGLPFKIGKFLLSKVSVKKNKPSSYTINFTGNLINIVDTLGKDELSSLDLSSLDHDYTHGNVSLGLQAGGLFSGDIIYNLLAKQRYVYSDDVAYEVADEITRNIAFGGADDSGVIWSDLKPSIRIIKIIEAIETEYTIANGYENPIVFSRNFFDTSEFTELYMWLNPEQDRGEGSETQRADWTGGSNTYVNHTTDIGTFTIEPNSRWDLKMTVRNQFAILPIDVTITMFIDDIKSTEISGTIYDFPGVDDRLELTASITSSILVDKEVYFEVTGTDISIDIEWEQKKYNSSNTLLDTQITTGENTLDNRFVIANNFPEMKIIDFLKGLFNMFKLVVVPQDDGTLFIDTLSSYYSAGTMYDVSRYVDYNSYSVERGQILNEIELKFQEPTTILNIQFEKNNGRGYGDEEIKLEDDNGKLLDGDTLTFTLPFEQIVYERLTDLSTGERTNIQYGSVIDESLEPANPKAHIFYNLIASIVTSPIGFQTGSLKTQLNPLINTPYHHYGVSIPTYATIFKNEFSTWNGVSIDNNLYTNHYQSYVLDIFNIKKRTFVYTAVLPIHIATKLELNDTLIIKGNYYRIDKYSYNLLSGKSTLNLINNFDTEIGEPTASNKIIYSDFVAKSEVTQITNLQTSTTVKIDNGWGTTWATLTNSDNNLDIALDEFSTTKGDVRSMIIRTTGTNKVEDIYINQTDKGFIASMDFSNPRNSQYLILTALRN